MDMFRYIPAWHDEPSFHGYCSNNNSINNEEELLISQWSMCNYYDASAPSLGSFLPEEEEDQLITANQSDTNHFSSSTSKEEQDEDNEGEGEDRREKGEDRREKEQKEGQENRKEKVEEGKRWKRQKVKISKDPQSVAARNRRHRISQKMRILKKLVPGGMKMDTASMLDEAVQYLKLLKAQVSSMQAVMNALENAEPFPFPMPMPMPMEYYN